MLRPYQQDIIDFIEEKKNVGIFLEPGLGKTLCILSYIALKKAKNSNFKALIVAPLRVILSTWPDEIAKWPHTQGLTFHLYHGANKAKSLDSIDILLINPDGLESFFTHHGMHFDLLVVDESTLFKSWKSKRFKLLKKQLKSDRFDQSIIMTGTPIPNGYLDLWAQIYLLDKGAALGKNITAYKNQYFYQTGYRGYNWISTTESKNRIWKQIKPFCKALKIMDVLDSFPEKETRIEPCVLSAGLYSQYNKLYTQFYIELKDSCYSAPNTVVKLIKCQQFINGAIYDQDKNIIEIHQEKINALLDLIRRLNNKNLLILYTYNTDLFLLNKYLPWDINIKVLNGKTSPCESISIINQWNDGDISILCAHPAAMAHGLNLQSGGNHIIWFGLTYNLEHYEQVNARLFRSGQQEKVIIHHILAKDTIDGIIYRALLDKNISQQTFLKKMV